MTRRLLGAMILVLSLVSFAFNGIAAEKETKQTDNPVVAMETSAGTIKIELWATQAPITVKNFLTYVNEGFYNGTVFHRVIDGFMIQGGGLDENLVPKKTREPIKNEASTELKNERGTIAMARTNVVDSATAQFFINVKNNDFLNHKDDTPRGFGYAVFGKVIAGMNVVDAIAKSKTGQRGPHQNVPVEPVVIKDVKLLRQ